MAVVLGSLRLSPATFWALTMPELDAMLRGALGISGGSAALSRNGLSELMARFPDRAHGSST